VCSYKVPVKTKVRGSVIDRVREKERDSDTNIRDDILYGYRELL